MPRPARLSKTLLAWAVTFGLLGALVGSSTFLLPSSHRAVVSLLVSALPSGSGNSDLASRAYLTKNRAETYARMMTSRQVLQPVIDEQQLDASVEELARTMTVEVPYETSVLSVTVNNSDPNLALDIANSVAKHAPPVLQELDREDPEAPARIQVTALGATILRSVDGSLQRWLATAVCALVGGVAGWHAARHRQLHRSALTLKEDDLHLALAGLPVLGHAGASSQVSPVSANTLLAQCRNRPGPLAVVGATSQVDAAKVARGLAESWRSQGTAAVLDTFGTSRSRAMLHGELQDLMADNDKVLLTGPALPLVRDPDSILLLAAAAVLVIPAREAHVQELLSTFNTLAKARVPVLGALIADDVHGLQRTLQS